MDKKLTELLEEDVPDYYLASPERTQAALEVSTAISLKRVADALEQISSRASCKTAEASGFSA